jgi:hypothetical protein
MILNVFVAEQTYRVEVPQFVIDEGDEFFAMLDRDMDKGYQMSRTWVENPDRVNRCQIVADRLLTALETDNQRLGMMMAGYILTRVPNVTGVRMNTEGDMLEHELILAEP